MVCVAAALGEVALWVLQRPAGAVRLERGCLPWRPCAGPGSSAGVGGPGVPPRAPELLRE